LPWVFEDACRRKGNSKDVVKVVARKLVNVVWYVWAYEKEFVAKCDELLGKSPV
jgi:hypothetical protein